MMKISLGMGWSLCLSALLALPALAQVSASGGKTKFDELSRSVVNRGDHTITLIRVKPPILPKAPPPPLPREQTAEEKAVAERRANKSYESIAITANVYVGKRTITELSWMEGDVKYRAISNVDFRLLTQLTDVETKDAVYLWLPFVSAVEGEITDSVSADEAKKLNADAADYVLLGSTEGKAAPKGLDLLDHLHAYAHLNDARLRSELAKREADELAAEEKRRRTPPPSPVITFWLETGAKR